MSAHGPAGGHSHEKTDATPRPIFHFVIGLVIFVAAAMVVMAMMFRYFSERETVLDTSASPLASEAPAEPPEPRLQPNPPVDLTHLRAEEEARLTSYGWVDREQNLGHIPIETAIDLILERGLPSRPEAPAEPAERR
jgi:hypothetical protein